MSTLTKRQTYRLATLLFAPIILFLILLIPTPNKASADENPFKPIQQQLASVENYQFAAKVEQTLIPRPIPVNIGQSQERLDIFVTGEATAPQKADLTLQIVGLGKDVPAIQLVQEGAYTYVVQDGERTLLENSSQLLTPLNDHAAYLAAADNIHLNEESSTNNTLVYTFDINGSRLVQTMQIKLQEQLPVSARQLGTTLTSQLEHMQGQGELWVDENGWPQRQILDLYFPEVNEAFDMRATTTIEYAFDEIVVIAEAETAVSPHPLTKLTITPATSQTATNIIPLLLITLFTLALIQNKRRLRRAVPIAITLTFVLTPILQIIDITNYETHTAQAASLPDVMNQQLTTASAADLPPVIHTTSNAISYQETSLSQSTPSITCGDGNQLLDTDADGLSDYVEICLGTDPYYYDSDYDGITDTLEITGFQHGLNTFYSNPTNPDSNEDGVADGAEWAAPHGNASHMDSDNDGLPNIWDDDNDNDQIPDEIDLDPFSTSNYYNAFDIESTNGHRPFDGYQYIELQIQPQDASHLYYQTTPLDWPFDEKGSITDLNNSKEDLFLSPYLYINQGTTPSEQLMTDYTVTKGRRYDYYGNISQLYIPLWPVTEGGKVLYFYAKVAYGPEDIHNISWQDMKMVWLASANIDEYNDSKQIQTSLDTINTYTESAFRIAGLQITMSDDVKSAWLGTPNSQDNDRDLFNLMQGLNATFLNYQDPDWQTVVDRFTNPTTPITHTWGVPTTNVAVTHTELPHADQILVDNDSRIRNFLTNQNYNTSKAASLVSLTEQKAGLYGLDDMSHEAKSAQKLSFHLSSIPLGTMRMVKLNMFNYKDGKWVALNTLDAIQVVTTRYDSNTAAQDAALTSLQTTYPALSKSDLIFVLVTMYTLWLNSLSNIVAVNGQAIVPTTADDVATTTQLARDTLNYLPHYLIEALSLAIPGKGLIFFDQGEMYRYMRQDQDLWVTVATGVANGLTDALNFFGINANVSGASVYQAIRYGYLYGYGSIVVVKSIYWLASGLRIASQTKALNLLKWVSFPSKLSKLAGVLSIIGIVAYQGVLTYVLVNSLTNPNLNEYERNEAIVTYVGQTILNIGLGILAFTVVGLIAVAALLLVNQILKFIYGIDSMDAFANAFYDYEALSQVDDLSFEGARVSVSGPLQVGAGLHLKDEFVGIIALTDAARRNWEVLYSHSYSKGYYKEAAPNLNYEVTINNEVMFCDLQDYGTVQECSNDVSAYFHLTTPAINVPLKVQAKAETQIRGRVCSFATNSCSYHNLKSTYPDDLPNDQKWDDLEIVLDVLPNTLDGLKNWSALKNHDKDGDGLLAQAERAHGTSDNNIDSDNDGLTDKFEVDYRAVYGTNPKKSDSDNDGLLDGQEYRLNLKINDPDSDDDGLLDGAEVPQWNGSTWSSGGWFVTIDGQPYHVFANPYKSDADWDGVNESSELANRTSPYGYNDAPRLNLTTAAVETSPLGASAIYLGPLIPSPPP